MVRAEGMERPEGMERAEGITEYSELEATHRDYQIQLL